MVTGAAVFRRDAAGWSGGFEERLSSFADGYMIRKVALTFGLCYAPHRLSHLVRVSRQRLAQDRDQSRQRPTSPNHNMSGEWQPIRSSHNGYRERFASRWRFSACRLAIQEPPNREFPEEVGAQNARDRAVYE